MTGMPKLLRMPKQPLLSNTQAIRTNPQSYSRSHTRPSWRPPPQNSSNTLKIMPIDLKKSKNQDKNNSQDNNMKNWKRNNRMNMDLKQEKNQSQDRTQKTHLKAEDIEE